MASEYDSCNHTFVVVVRESIPLHEPSENLVYHLRVIQHKNVFLASNVHNIFFSVAEDINENLLF